MGNKWLIPLILCVIFVSGAFAERSTGFTAGPCEVDSNNLLYSDCHEITLSAGDDRFQWRYINVSADITGINGAAAARGTYERDSLGVFWRRNIGDQRLQPFVGLGVGGSRIDYTAFGPADDFDFIVKADGMNYSWFWSVEGGLTYRLTDDVNIKVSGSYLQHPDQLFKANVGRPGDGGFNGEPRTYSFAIGLEIKH